jgi:hypothetical protein
MDVHASLAELSELKVDDLAQRFHQPRAAVVCHIMHWGLSRAQTETRDGGETKGPVRHLYLLVGTALHARVEKSATAACVKSAPWLRSMVRQITLTDVPASWHEATPEERSHDSRIYDTRGMLRLDQTSQTKLQQLISHLRASTADIIHHLMLQATPEDFPTSWHLNTAAHRLRQAPHDAKGSDRVLTR